MSDKHLYEYAVIRIVPKLEREEFINIGLIMFSKKKRYIRAQYEVNKQKISVFSIELDYECIDNQLQTFNKICSGDNTGGVIATMDVAERFRWLTAVRSTSIQTSRPHSGFSSDLDETFDRLYTELVK